MQVLRNYFYVSVSIERQVKCALTSLPTSSRTDCNYQGFHFSWEQSTGQFFFFEKKRLSKRKFLIAIFLLNLKNHGFKFVQTSLVLVQWFMKLLIDFVNIIVKCQLFELKTVTISMAISAFLNPNSQKSYRDYLQNTPHVWCCTIALAYI